jgi:hypothetical protein
MKFRREYKAEFMFTGPETFTFITADNFRLISTSINDILYITIPCIHINAITTRSKRRLDEPAPELESLKRFRIAPLEQTPITSPELEAQPLITCILANLWHLRYSYASATTLRKHKYIHSTYDSSNCISCIEAKKTR